MQTPIESCKWFTELYAISQCSKHYKTKEFELFVCQYLYNNICEIRLAWPMSHHTILWHFLLLLGKFLWCVRLLCMALRIINYAITICFLNFKQWYVIVSNTVPTTIDIGCQIQSYQKILNDGFICRILIYLYYNIYFFFFKALRN